MADFDLTQSGQEVQDILDGAAMQTDLTAEVDRAELAEQTLQGNIDIEEARAKAAEKQNADNIDVIEEKIPAAASSENQLADKAFVNSSIATATATYRGAYNLVSDLSLAVDATHEQIAAALAGEISTADNNDYCFVQIPTSSETPTQIASIERYKFNGSAWSYEYTLNNSGFTADQWAALNSGITSGLVTKLLALPTNDELILALAGKQNVLTFDNVPIENSNNPVKSSGVYSAIGTEETRAKAAEKANADDIDAIEEKIPAAASSENQLADKNFVNSSIATATATFKGTYNLVNDLSLTVAATHEQIATALAGEISTADNNDYCFVQIPTSDAAPTQIASIERYKFNGTAWSYEYTLNNSGFTADQWAALNSGITSGLVAKLAALPTNDEIVLALAGKQDVLTFDNEPTENSNNPVKSGGVYDAIDVEASTRAAAIAAIVALIPEAASALNQLADKAFVNSSISTATAVFKGTFNVVVDLELNYNATQEQIALMLASKIIAADNNDYCFVQIPTSDETPLQIARTDRYKFNGSAWAYEYTLNNSGFTSVQWAAINSGITSLLKDKLIDLPTATELATLLAAKQNELTFDTTPTTGSTNPVTSQGIKNAIDAEATRAEAAEEALDTDKADKATTLAGYGITDAYTKSEVNGLVSTPHQNYVTVATYASLPASGSTDTIYRVSSYDGANSQVDDTVYSEYAWNGTQYIFLCVKSQIEEVFDITVYNSNTKYADLAAALGVDGANIPSSLRRGGMSVKFVQSSDNNYIQARLIANTFTIDITKWQTVDEEPTAGSKNLVESGGVASALGILPPETVTVYDSDNNILAENNGILQPSGVIFPGNVNYLYSNYVDLTNVSKLITKANYYSTDSGVLFYNANKEYISSIKKDPVVTNNSELTINKNEIPEGAAYLRINFMSPSAGAGNYYLKKEVNSLSHEERIENLENSVSDIKNLVAAETETLNKISSEKYKNNEITNYGLFANIIQNNYYINGVLTSNALFDATAPMVLDRENDIYPYFNGGANSVIFFDENKEYIANSQINGVKYNVPVRVSDFPINAKYIAFSWVKTDLLSDVFATRNSYIPQMGWKIYSDVLKVRNTRPKIYVYNTDTETVILQKLVKAYITKDCDVFFEYGEYNFQQIYIDMVDVWGVGNVQGSWQRELPLGGNCKYDLNGSTITGTLPSGQTDGKVFGNMRHGGQSYTLCNGKIINDGMVYAIHDEGQNEPEFYQHNYKNIEIVNNGGTAGIGLGTGISGVVNVDKCIFKGNDDTKAAIAGHGITNQSITDDAVFELNVSNCWINTSVNATSLGVNQIAKLIVCGCSVGSLYTTSNWDKYYFCNEIRE